MKIPYKNELNELIRWISNTNAIIGSSRQITHLVQEVQQVTHLITVVSNGIYEEYPFYSKLLPEVASRLFMNFMGSLRLNTAAFGELAVIIRHINEEPVDLKLWENIHPRIQKISKGLYVDSYYDSAAEKAIKEVETRLREKFKELKPSVTVPTKVGDIIGALLTENGAFKFSDTSTASGKDYRRGVQALFEGTMAAYRNPSAHENLSLTKRKALEQIMLASQLMYILDKPPILEHERMNDSGN